MKFYLKGHQNHNKSKSKVPKKDLLYQINKLLTGVNISRKECAKRAGIVLGFQGRVYYFGKIGSYFHWKNKDIKATVN